MSERLQRSAALQVAARPLMHGNCINFQHVFICIPVKGVTELGVVPGFSCLFFGMTFDFKPGRKLGGAAKREQTR